MASARAFIVDDEAPARKRIIDLLAKHPDVEVAGQFRSGEDALPEILDEPPDLLFLDIQMPGLDGFAVLEQLPPESVPVTVFVTAYDRHALKAFEVNALDYLLKPFSDERFEMMLERARRQLRSSKNEKLSESLVRAVEHFRQGSSPNTITGNDTGTEHSRYLDRLVVKNAGRVTFLPTIEIDWIEAAGVYVRVHVGKKLHVLRETLNSLEQRLDPKSFVRIHRSSIVAIDRIKELVPDGRSRYCAILTDGTRIRLSQTYKAALQERLKQKI